MDIPVEKVVDIPAGCRITRGQQWNEKLIAFPWLLCALKLALHTGQLSTYPRPGDDQAHLSNARFSGTLVLAAGDQRVGGDREFYQQAQVGRGPANEFAPSCPRGPRSPPAWTRFPVCGGSEIARSRDANGRSMIY